MRPRGFIYNWQPNENTRRLLEHVAAVLSDYRDYLPVTLRQVYYRLVAKNVIDKTERAYKRLCEACNKARRADIIKWADIRDDGLMMRDPGGFTEFSEVINTLKGFAGGFRYDRQQGQPKNLIVWCEAQGMAPQLQRIAGPYSIPVYSSGGFDSVTTKHNFARDLPADKESLILHFGDHDPSGVHMYLSLFEDISAFAERFGGEVELHRIAVTPEQITDMNLPAAPPKKTDNRRFDGETVQAEAIPPDRLASIAESAIVHHIDHAALRIIHEREKRDQKLLTRFIDSYPEWRANL